MEFTYAYPRNGSTERSSHHGSTKGRRWLRSDVFCDQLLGCFIDTKVDSGANRVSHSMKVETRVEPADSVTTDDLLKRFDCSQTRLLAERRVSDSIR